MLVMHQKYNYISDVKHVCVMLSVVCFIIGIPRNGEVDLSSRTREKGASVEGTVGLFVNLQPAAGRSDHH